MAFFKCKMCGGELELQPNSNIAECLYCGSKQTVPNADDDKKLRLYNRANQYRLDNEFEKAYNAYEAIISEKEDESEAYWGLVLSEYGVEYVEDPLTKNRIPTCHRTLVKSVKSNENFKLACKFADSESRMMYEDEAEALDRLQKKILTVASREEPYDVFICYKETDANGDRTTDSVLAQEIYDELTKHGFRVFFSRISLEDKLGKDYEPCIYAALTSAKVMLMVTTDSEHCNAVWVKNEWKRFIDFMKNDNEKVLIPVYRDISPYALPDEFAKLQAQDMSKLGAVQDLVRGVEKILGKGRHTSQGGLDAHEKKLLEKIEKNEKRKSHFIKICVIGVTTMIFATILLYLTSALPMFYMRGIPIMTGHVLSIFAMPLMIVILALDIGWFINWTKGVRSKVSHAIYFTLFLLFSFSLFVAGVMGIIAATTIKCLYIEFTIFTLLATFITYTKNKKVISFGTVVVAFFAVTMLVCGRTPRQTNERDESKVQIQIENATLNVRESATTNSSRVSVVNKGDIFTVLDIVESSEYTWYKITTNLDVTGYVAAGKQHEYVKMLSSEDSLNQSNIRDASINQIRILDDNIVLRDKPSENADLIGRVYAEDIYTVGEVTFEPGLVWYEITTADGTNGYINCSTITDTRDIEELLIDRISYASVFRDNSVWQIRVLEEYRNLRAKPDSGSDIIGKVFMDEIFTVADVICDEGNRIWYKVVLPGDLEGYLYAMDSHKYFESLPANSDGTGQGNVPDENKEQITIGYVEALYVEADEASDICGVLLEGEVYDILNMLELVSGTWYEVETNYGLHGFVKR